MVRTMMAAAGFGPLEGSRSDGARRHGERGVFEVGPTRHRAFGCTVEQLNERARLHLAPRPTVTSHLVQAQEHLAGLRRTLTHATETLAYNTAQRSPLSAAF